MHTNWFGSLKKEQHCNYYWYLHIHQYHSDCFDLGWVLRVCCVVILCTWCTLMCLVSFSMGFRHVVVLQAVVVGDVCTAYKVLLDIVIVGAPFFWSASWCCRRHICLSRSSTCFQSKIANHFKWIELIMQKWQCRWDKQDAFSVMFVMVLETLWRIHPTSAGHAI